MLIRKINPKGIDATIDRLQKKVYDQLGWTNYESYHRVYVNETINGLVPERFDGDIDYIDVFFDDRYNATSYFVVNSPVNMETLTTYSVDYYFQVKTDKLFPSVTHRADEEVHEQVLQALLKATVGYRQIGQLILGLRNVYGRFDQSQIRWADMEPFHVFKFRLNLVKEKTCQNS